MVVRFRKETVPPGREEGRDVDRKARNEEQKPSGDSRGGDTFHEVSLFST